MRPRAFVGMGLLLVTVLCVVWMRQSRTVAQSGQAYQAMTVSGGGSISGTIGVSGTIPALPRRQINKDPAVCGTALRASEALIVNRGGLKNAVVYLENVRRGKAFTPPAAPSQIDQKGCEYAPHVQVVPFNTEVSIVNSDPTLHNIHAYVNKGADTFFNYAQPIQRQVNKKVFNTRGLVYVECDVHGWMQAHILVVDNPYYAVTDDTGKFTLRDIPAGTYTAKVWHEYLGEKTQTINVAASADAPLSLDLRDLLNAKQPAPPATAAAPARGAAPPAGPASAGGQVVKVEMHSDGGFRYVPNTLTVKVGTTVQWVNVSDNRHSATSDPQFEKTKGQAIIPAGVTPWGSQFLPNGGNFTYTFTLPGTYQYFCRNHEQFGMVGKVIVER